MAASTDAASAVEALDRLVRVVRADADGRHQLAVRAAFVGALARSHPEVVREPGGKRAWTPAALSALAAATTALLESKHELHCVVGVDDFAVNVSYKKKSLVYVRAELAPALRVLTYASLPPPASGESNRESNADEGQRPTTVRDATTVQAGAPAALDARASEALARRPRARRSTTSNPNPRSAPFRLRKTLTPSKTPARKRPRRDAPRATPAGYAFRCSARSQARTGTSRTTGPRTRWASRRRRRRRMPCHSKKETSRFSPGGTPRAGRARSRRSAWPSRTEPR